MKFISLAAVVSVRLTDDDVVVYGPYEWSPGASSVWDIGKLIYLAPPCIVTKVNRENCLGVISVKNQSCGIPVGRFRSNNANNMKNMGCTGKRVASNDVLFVKQLVKY